MPIEGDLASSRRKEFSGLIGGQIVLAGRRSVRLDGGLN